MPRRGSAVALILTLAVASGCGAGRRHESFSADGRAVLRDINGGRLSRAWSCGSLRAALARLPVSPPAHSTLPLTIGRAAADACDSALGNLRVGTTRANVLHEFGEPTSGHRCWLLRWPPADEGQTLAYRMAHPSKQRSNVDGARVCFSSGRVSAVQVAMHG